MRNSINWALAWVFVLGWLLVELLRLETASVRTGEDRASHGLVGGSKFRRFGEEFVGFFAAPMTIRGRVVDQFGFSVVDANIEVIFSRVLSPDYGEVRELRKADLLGEFLVDGKNVEHVSIRATRDGYQWVDGMPGGESGSSATVSQFDVEGRGANGVREVVLRLHRLNPGRLIVHYPPRTYAQRSEEEMIVVTIDGADEGSVEHIRVEILGPDSEDFTTVTSGVTEATFDWSHRVTVPGGGMVVVDGFAGLTAPLDGYSEVDLVRIEKGEEYWKLTLERKYYVRLPSGRFAAVVVFSRWFRGVRTTEVQMWVNEEPGDRELSGGKVPLW